MSQHKHTTTCPAYNTKGRELGDRPCDCGYRHPAESESKNMTADELLACFPEFTVDG